MIRVKCRVVMWPLQAVRDRLEQEDGEHESPGKSTSLLPGRTPISGCQTSGAAMLGSSFRCVISHTLHAPWLFC